MIDTSKSSPMGKFIMHMFGAFAEFERDLIVERVRAGVAEAKRKGKHCGRPKKILRRDQVAALRKQSLSWRAISRQLKIPVSTLRDTISA